MEPPPAVRRVEARSKTHRQIASRALAFADSICEHALSVPMDRGGKRAMRAKIAVVLMGVVLVACICFTSPDEDRGVEGKESIQSALARFRRTGCFNHESYPLVVRARRCRGDTLYFVDILCRNDNGRGFKWVAKAVQATLHYSEECESPGFPFGDPVEPPAPQRRESLRVRVCQIDIRLANETEIWMDDRQFDFPLPSLLATHGFRPFAQAERQLLAREREALGKDYPLHPAQRLLIAAFGEEGDTLLQAEPLLLERGRSVCVFERPVAIRTDYQFPVFAIAQLDRSGGPFKRFRGRDVLADQGEFLNLTRISANEDDTQALSWSVENGHVFSAQFQKE
jgi:hypothetical protein